jgi:hypothetical protein
LVYLAGGVLMGLISLISRLGKTDCNTPCQPIECGFNCATCLDFQFNLRVTWLGMQNTINCNLCTSLAAQTSGPYGPITSCTLSTLRIFEPAICGDPHNYQIDLGADSIRVRLNGSFWAWEHRLTGPEVLAQLCNGGQVVVPFFSEGGAPGPFSQLCNGANSTVLIEVIPIGGGALAATHDIELAPRLLSSASGEPDLNDNFLLAGGVRIDDQTRSYVLSAADQTIDGNNYYGWMITLEPTANLVSVDMRKAVVSPSSQTEYSLAHYEGALDALTGSGITMLATPRPDPNATIYTDGSILHLRAYPR